MMSTPPLLRDFTKEKLVWDLRRCAVKLNQLATATETGTETMILYRRMVEQCKYLAEIVNMTDGEINRDPDK